MKSQNGDRKPRIGTLLPAIAGWQRRHWVITLIFVDLAGFWIPILYSYFGIQLGLLDFSSQSYQFTAKGIIVLAILFLVLVTGNSSRIYEEKTGHMAHEIDSLKKELFVHKESGLVLRDLNSSANEICESKLATLMEEVSYFIDNETAIPPEIISDPCKQLSSLAKELSSCVAGLLKFQERRHITELFTSIIYRFPNDSDNSWHWATPERGLSISELMYEKDGQCSTFMHLLKGRGHSVLFNSKEQAKNDKSYIPDSEDEYDENGNLKGSIACFAFEIKKNDKLIVQFVITVSSYGQQFVQGKDNGDESVRTTRHNLDKIVIPNYAVRAKIELLLLYLKKLNETRCKKHIS